MESKEKFKTVVVATINGINIIASTEDDRLVPIRPICDLFGIAPNGQIEKLNSDPLYRSVSKLRLSTGADGKQYEMYCLPLAYLFAWMLGINSANVKPEIREKLIAYQKECVFALEEHFYGKHLKREKSFEISARLEVEKQALMDNEKKSDDLKRWLEIEKELKQQKIDRSKDSRKVFVGMVSFFTEKEMTGK